MTTKKKVVVVLFYFKNMTERFRPSPKDIAGRRALRPDSKFRQPRIIEVGKEDLEILVREACLGKKTGVDVGQVLLKMSEFLDDEALDFFHQCVQKRQLPAIRRIIEFFGKRRSALTATCHTINKQLLNDQAEIDWEKLQLQLGISPPPKKT